MDSIGKSDETRTIRIRALSKLKRIPLPVFLVIILATAAVIAGVVVLVVFPDFSISADPIMVAANNDYSIGGMTIVHITSLRSFSGVVTLDILRSPTVNAWFSYPGCSPNCTSTTTLLGHSSDIPLEVSTQSPLDSTLGIKAGSGFISHTLSLPIVAREIRITLQHPNATIQQNGSVSSTVTITSLNGASGNASLTSSLTSYCRDCGVVGRIVTPQSVLLLPNTSDSVNLTVFTAAFTVPITYNVTFIASLCCSTYYRWTKYYAVTVVYAPESISLASYQFNSNTTATLNITNNLGLDDQLYSYQLTNATGNVYNYGYDCYPGSCFGPILGASATTPIILNTYGGFLFRPGQTYTLTFTTTRNNRFPVMITR